MHFYSSNVQNVFFGGNRGPLILAVVTSLSVEFPIKGKTGNVIFDASREKVVTTIELRAEVVRNYLRFGFLFSEIRLTGVNLLFNTSHLLDPIDCERALSGKAYAFDPHFMGHFLALRSTH